MNRELRIKIIKILSEAAIYVPANDESYRIEYLDIDEVFMTGEGSGNHVSIKFEDIDLDRCTFYKLVPMNIQDY